MACLLLSCLSWLLVLFWMWMWSTKSIHTLQAQTPQTRPLLFFRLNEGLLYSFTYLNSYPVSQPDWQDKWSDYSMENWVGFPRDILRDPLLVKNPLEAKKVSDLLNFITFSFPFRMVALRTCLSKAHPKIPTSL